MDRGGDELIGWSIDGLAAGLLGIAGGACLLLLGLPREAIAAAVGLCLAALAGLRQIRPEARRFRLPDFALQPVEFVANADADAEATGFLDLTEAVADEPLDLDDRLPQAPEDSRVVQLFAPRDLPTPGELARRIDHHLERDSEDRGGKVLELEVDAAAALRQALGELRRSLA